MGVTAVLEVGLCKLNMQIWQRQIHEWMEMMRNVQRFQTNWKRL
jgi:hypothetical protein